MTTIRFSRSRGIFLAALMGLLAMLLSMTHRVEADEPSDTTSSSSAGVVASQEVTGTSPVEESAPPSDEVGPEAVAALQFKRRLAGGNVVHSSPTFADVDGDGKQEILIGTTDQRGGNTGRPAYIGAYNSTTGLPLWETPTGTPVNASLVVANLDGQGDPEVIVAIGGSTYNNHHYKGGVRAYNARTGAFIWEWLSEDDLPHGNGDGFPDGVFATPAAGDVDGDGDMEIAFGSWDRNIYMLDHRGREVWRYHAADTVWSSAAMADLNRDGDLEIITGADISGENAGGYLWVFNPNGTVLFSKHVPGAVYSSPAVGDLDGDNDLEIVVGSNKSTLNTNDPRGRIYAWDHTGALLPGWPVLTGAGQGISSPALGDIDGNGDLEIFVGAEDGKLYGLHHNGSNVSGWPVNFGGRVWSSPTIGDHDGDGQLEVFVAWGWSVFALNSRGAREAEWNSGYTIESSPAIGDPDGDGKVEIVIGGSQDADPAYGYLHAWESGSASGAGFPWPMFQQNAQHTGLYPMPSAAVPFTGPFTVMYQEGSSTQSTRFYLENNGSVPFTWTADGTHQRVTVTPASGTIQPGQRMLVRVAISAADLGAGSYPLGELVITFGGGGDQLTPIRVPVRVVVGDISGVYLPLVRR